MKQLAVIPLFLHGAIEYLAGLALVLSPFIFGFDENGFATTTAVVLGVLVLLVALVSDTPVSAARVVPMSIHEGFDFLVALALILFPFVTEITDDHGTATLFFVVLGVAHFVITLATRFPRKLGRGDAVTDTTERAGSDDPLAKQGIGSREDRAVEAPKKNVGPDTADEFPDTERHVSGDGTAGPHASDPSARD